METQNPITEYLQAMRAHNAAVRAATSPVERFRASRRFSTEGKQAALNRAFGKINGWKLTKNFALCDIGRSRRTFASYREGWMDHQIYYRDSARRNIAIATQPYGNHPDDFRAELDRCAEEFGLRWHVPPVPRASFWYPGWTLFIVMTLPGVELKWLPEQVSGLRI
jgi:hypothetical protein